MTGNNYDEKRDFVRMRVETQVTYHIKDNSAVTYNGLSMDLSATGLYMTTDFAPAIKDVIEIVMNPSGERLPPFVAEGRVIRCEVDENNAKLFHVSVELLEAY